MEIIRSQSNPPSIDRVSQQAEQAIASLLAQKEYRAEPAGTSLQELAELALHPDRPIAASASQILFSQLVDPLATSFSARDVIWYEKIFAHLIQTSRHAPGGSQIDRLLKRFGLFDSADILSRRKSKPTLKLFPPERLQRCVILSRVTIGGELAVNSVIIAALLEHFPQAEIVLVANQNMQRLFSNQPRLHILDFNYPTTGTLLERLQSWVILTELIEKELNGLEPEECLVIDPDSRLTQLGLLPLTSEDQRYLFFESRTFQRPDCHYLAELTTAWLQESLICQPAKPFLALAPSATAFAEALRQRIPPGATWNGLNLNAKPHKQESFENQANTFQQASSANQAPLLVFAGVGAHETAHSERLVQAVRLENPDLSVLYLNGSDPQALPARIDEEIILWQGDLGTYCALIGQLDLLIGYDSSGRHIAAITGTPAVTIYADSPYTTHAARWTPPALTHMLLYAGAPHSQTVHTSFPSPHLPQPQEFSNWKFHSLNPVA